MIGKFVDKLLTFFVLLYLAHKLLIQFTLMINQYSKFKTPHRITIYISKKIINKYTMTEYMQMRRQKQEAVLKVYQAQDGIQLVNRQKKLAKSEQDKMNQQLAKQISELADFKASREKIEKIIQEIKKAMEESQSSIEDYQVLIQILEKQMNDLQNKITAINEAIEDLKQRIEKKSVEVQDLKKEMNNIVAEIKRFDEEIKNLQLQIFLLEMKYEQARNKRKRRSIRQKINKLLSVLNKKTRILSVTKEKINEVSREINGEILFIENKNKQLATEKTSRQDKQQKMTNVSFDKTLTEQKQNKQEKKQKTFQGLLNEANSRLSQNGANAKEKNSQVDAINTKIKQNQVKIKEYDDDLFEKNRDLSKKEFEVTKIQNRMNQFKEEIQRENDKRMNQFKEDEIKKKNENRS